MEQVSRGTSHPEVAAGRLPQVHGELERLGNAVGELEAKLEELTKRLMPVMQDAPPSTGKPLVEPVPEPLVAVAGRIQAARMTVNRCISAVQDILCRLEV